MAGRQAHNNGHGVRYMVWSGMASKKRGRVRAWFRCMVLCLVIMRVVGGMRGVRVEKRMRREAQRGHTSGQGMAGRDGCIASDLCVRVYSFVCGEES